VAFTTCVYRKGVREDHPLPFEQISDVLEQPDTLVWVDVNSPDESEVAQLGEEFGLHRLALADALSDHQRPKMERYEGYVFVIAYAAAIGEAGRVDMQEVAIFVSQRFVVSIRLHAEDLSVEQGVRMFREMAFLEEANARREAERGAFDPTYLVYSVGKLMLQKLRHDVEAKEGDAFSLRNFHDSLLKQGAAPFTLHRRLMLGDTGTVLD